MPYKDKDYRRFRESPIWARMKAEHLAAHPICERCNIAPATRCRHKAWCRGEDNDVVWERYSPHNIESVCSECAASAKDHSAYQRAVDADGYPIDPRHPANKHR